VVFIVRFLGSQLSYSGGHYVEVLGLSAAGELGWDTKYCKTKNSASV